MTETSRAIAQDDLFPRPFAWTDRKGTAWFGILVGTALPSLLMLWRYNTSVRAHRLHLPGRPHRGDRGHPLLHVGHRPADLPRLPPSARCRVGCWPATSSVAGASVLFSMWVTFASGYQVVYQALVVILAGLILYAFLNARRQRLGESERAGRPSPRCRRCRPSATAHQPSEPSPSDQPTDRRETVMTFHVDSEVGQLRQAIVHRPGLELSRLTPENIGELLFDDVMWAKKAKEEHDAFAEALRDKGVRVHYYGQLLAETLELPEGRAFVLDRLCTPEILGPSLVGPGARASSRTSTAPRWPSTWSVASSRPTCTRCGPTA